MKLNTIVSKACFSQAIRFRRKHPLHLQGKKHQAKARLEALFWLDNWISNLHSFPHNFKNSAGFTAKLLAYPTQSTHISEQHYSIFTLK